MLRPLVRFVVALLLLAGALVALAPSTLWSAAIDRAVNPRLLLVDTDGTIWSGRGTLADSTGSRLPFGWQLSPWRLPTGEVQVAIRPASDGLPGPRADLRARRGAIALSNVDVVVPVSFAAAMAPEVQRLSLAGNIRLAIGELDWRPPNASGGGRITWQGARVTWADVPSIDLGALTGLAVANGERIVIHVTNEGGDMAVVGEITFDAGGHGQLGLTLTPKGAADAALVRALDAIGTRDGAGWRVGAGFALG